MCRGEKEGVAVQGRSVGGNVLPELIVGHSGHKGEGSASAGSLDSYFYAWPFSKDRRRQGDFSLSPVDVSEEERRHFHLGLLLFAIFGRR